MFKAKMFYLHSADFDLFNDLAFFSRVYPYFIWSLAQWCSLCFKDHMQLTSWLRPIQNDQCLEWFGLIIHLVKNCWRPSKSVRNNDRACMTWRFCPVSTMSLCLFCMSNYDLMVGHPWFIKLWTVNWINLWFGFQTLPSLQSSSGFYNCPLCNSFGGLVGLCNYYL